MFVSSRPLVAVTLGDVSGIGPEIVLQSVQHERVRTACRPLIIGHAEFLRRASASGRMPGDLAPCCLSDRPHSRRDLLKAFDSLSESGICVWNPVAGDCVLSAQPRTVNAVAGDAAFRCVQAAAKLALDGIVDAVATAPISKAALHQAGHHYPGHTEILAELCRVDDFAMMLHLPESRLRTLRSVIASETVISNNAQPCGTCGLSIAHVTLHTALAAVPGQLTTPAIVSTTLLMRNFLRQLGSDRESIAVAALNPHGGEAGLFGAEESTIIAPAVETAREHGCRVTGPLPADTLMRRALAGEFDGVIAMYHDQGHIPVKLTGFDTAANITLGLPIVRTSPTHGTAFDRAWNPDTPADASGMIEAILTAVRLCGHRSRNR